MSASPVSGGTGLSIGAVLKRLQPEFPDLSISKIRFLEGKGLVHPHRTGTGYRYFSDADVTRLEFILRAQRDRFWPLKVISDALDAMDRGLVPPETLAPGASGGGSVHASVPEAQPDDHLPGSEELVRGQSYRLTAAELRAGAGVDESQLSAMMEYGLVHADADGHFDDLDLAVARQVAYLAGFGIEARHLRPFRMAADRELGLVNQAVAPLRGRPGLAEQVAATESEILQHCIALHVALVRAGLRDLD